MGAFSRLRSYRLSPWGRTWLSRGVALVGFGLLAKILLETGIVGAGGSGGYDATAYWTAARRVLDGLPLYGGQTGVFGAYLYPPPLAQILTPAALLPSPAFVWAWRLLELVSLRIAVGGWVRAGWVMLFPPVISELDAGNVHLIMAAACAIVMRGGSLPIGPATLLKFAALPLAPLGWLQDRRGLILGGVIAAAIVVISYALAPSAWAEYLAFIGTARDAPGFWNLGAAIPFPVRVVLAVAVGLLAIRWIRLAPVAVLLALPVIWIASLSTLVALFAPVRRLRPVTELGTAPLVAVGGLSKASG